MSSSALREATLGHSHDLVVLNWPARQEPGRTAGTLALFLALAGYTWISTSSGVMGLLVLMGLLGSTWRLWIPVHFELGPRGITQRIGASRRRIPWRLIAGYQVRDRGVFLFADGRDGSLALFRALFIRNPPQPEQLHQVVERYLGSC